MKGFALARAQHLLNSSVLGRLDDFVAGRVQEEDTRSRKACAIQKLEQVPGVRARLRFYLEVAFPFCFSEEPCFTFNHDELANISQV